MASYNPPTEQLPIFDNEVFTPTSTGSGLTIAQANLLYLRKTFPDTATALETFQAGIQTDNIDAIGGFLITIGNATTNVYLNAINNLQLTTSDPFGGGSINVVSDYVNIGDINLTQNLTMESLTLLSLGSTTISTETATLDLNNTNPNANTINIGSLVNSSTSIKGSSMGLQSTTMVVNINTISTIATTSITETAPLIDVYADTLSLNSNYSTTNNINIGNVSTTDTLQQNANTLNLNYTKATPNAINIGTNNTTAIDANTTALKLNSVNTTANTVAIGNLTGTSSTEIIGTALKLNSTKTTANTVDIGNLTGTSATDINGTALKLNSSKTTANTVAIGNATGTTSITVNKPITIGYAIAPTVGQIGYSFQPTTSRVDSLPVGTAVAQNGSMVTTTALVPQGVYIISSTQNIECTVAAGTINSIALSVRNITTGGAPIANQQNQSSFTQPVGTAVASLNVAAANIVALAGAVFTFTYDINYTGVGATYVFYGNQTRQIFTRVG